MASGTETGGSQPQPREPIALGSALAGVAIPAAAQKAIAVPNTTFLAKGVSVKVVAKMYAPSGPFMPRTERGDADADEKAGVVAIQAALLHHVIGDVGGGSTAI